MGIIQANEEDGEYLDEKVEEIKEEMKQKFSKEFYKTMKKKRKKVSMLFAIKLNDMKNRTFRLLKPLHSQLSSSKIEEKIK